MRKSRVVLSFVFASCLLLVLALLPGLAAAGETDAARLRAVWERVRQSGAYHFRADVAQTIHTKRAGVAYGPTTQTSRLYMEGQTDLREGLLAQGKQLQLRKSDSPV